MAFVFFRLRFIFVFLIKTLSRIEKLNHSFVEFLNLSIGALLIIQLFERLGFLYTHGNILNGPEHFYEGGAQFQRLSHHKPNCLLLNNDYVFFAGRSC
jgi:hypothetical protein